MWPTEMIDSRGEVNSFEMTLPKETEKNIYHFLHLPFGAFFRLIFGEYDPLSQLPFCLDGNVWFSSLRQSPQVVKYRNLALLTIQTLEIY